MLLIKVEIKSIVNDRPLASHIELKQNLIVFAIQCNVPKPNVDSGVSHVNLLAKIISIDN